MIQRKTLEAPEAAQQSSAPVPAQTTPAAAAAPQTVCGIPNVGNVAATYRALVEQRRELQQQRVGLVNTRDGWSQRLRQAEGTGTVNEGGIQAYIKDIDVRLADVTGQLAATNAKVACMAGVPGAIVEPPPNNDELTLAGLFVTFFLTLPFAIAWARRIWRRGAKLVPFMPPQLDERLTRIEQSVESVAIEVERVGEGQRFVTNLIAQNGPRAIGAGAMEPVEVQQRERVAQERFDR